MHRPFRLPGVHSLLRARVAGLDVRGPGRGRRRRRRGVLPARRPPARPRCRSTSWRWSPRPAPARRTCVPQLLELTKLGFAYVGEAYLKGLRDPRGSEMLKAATAEQKDWPAARHAALVAECRVEAQKVYDNAGHVADGRSTTRPTSGSTASSSMLAAPASSRPASKLRASRTSARTRPWAAAGSACSGRAGRSGCAGSRPPPASLKPAASTSARRNDSSMRCSVPDSEMPVPGRPAWSAIT